MRSDAAPPTAELIDVYTGGGSMKQLYKHRRALILLTGLAAIMLVMPAMAEDAAEKIAATSHYYNTFWALVPSFVAIILALITKEVYSSLFIGITVGAVLAANGNFERTLENIFTNGIVASVSDSYNVGILVFLIMLGSIVALMNKAGGSAAFGRWAEDHIKTRRGAQLSTILLGILIFIDDYFNCLTVGSVMRPVTDRHKISRAKLAYLIDATAAPYVSSLPFLRGQPRFPASSRTVQVLRCLSGLSRITSTRFLP